MFRTFLLLCCVLLNLHVGDYTFNRVRIFRLLNLNWLVGILVAAIPYIRSDKFQVTYTSNYILQKGCQPNYPFQIQNGNCLLSKMTQYLLFVYYAVFCAVIFAIAAAFVTILVKAKLEWKKSSRKEERSRTTEVAIHDIQVDYYYTVISKSVPLSFSALFYLIVYVPILTRQFWIISDGPFRSTVTATILETWYIFSGDFIALLNLLFYGAISSVLRSEISRFVHKNITPRFCSKNRGRGDSSNSANRDSISYAMGNVVNLSSWSVNES